MENLNREQKIAVRAMVESFNRTARDFDVFMEVMGIEMGEDGTIDIAESEEELRPSNPQVARVQSGEQPRDEQGQFVAEDSNDEENEEENDRQYDNDFKAKDGHDTNGQGRVVDPKHDRRLKQNQGRNKATKQEA